MFYVPSRYNAEAFPVIRPPWVECKRRRSVGIASVLLSRHLPHNNRGVYVSLILESGVHVAPWAGPVYTAAFPSFDYVKGISFMAWLVTDRIRRMSEWTFLGRSRSRRHNKWTSEYGWRTRTKNETGEGDSRRKAKKDISVGILSLGKDYGQYPFSSSFLFLIDYFIDFNYF